MQQGGQKFWNVPNALTLLRLLLIPVYWVLMMSGHDEVWALVVFVAASLTDLLDGYLARRDNLVTNFGKFADPVADKILALSVMVALLARGLYPWWAVCIVVARELAVDGLRLVSVEQGVVIPAGTLGKIKTNFQFFCVLASLLSAPGWLVTALCAVMALLTAASGAQYFKSSRHLFTGNGDSPTKP